MRYALLVFGLASVLLIPGSASAQGICQNGTKSTKLICVVPEVYGAEGLGVGPNNTDIVYAQTHSSAFEGDFVSSQGLGPINEAIGVQLAELPVASPSNSISFTYDTSLKTFVPSNEETLGPIIGERAGTIGRRRVYVGFSFEYFNFSTIDGQNLNNLTTVLQHQPTQGMPLSATQTDPGLVPCANTTGMFPKYTTLPPTAPPANPCFTRDFFQATNNIDLSAQQYSIYLTYGLTSRLDFSAVIPILHVNVSSSNTTTIFPNSVALPVDGPDGVFHQFNPSGVPSCPASSVQPGGAPCLTASFSNSGRKTGIGDVALRGKYEIYKGERVGFAAGVNVRLPSGDAENFLGSGTTGVEPFGVISYSARVSPHGEVGYEWNGKSILTGDYVGLTATNSKASIPNRFLYTVGADVAIVKRVTGAFDIYGQRLFSASQLFSTTYTDQGKCSDANCTTVTAGTSHTDLGVRASTAYNITDASLGVKFRPAGKLVISLNVLLKLDDAGLRSRAVPLVGASYSF